MKQLYMTKILSYKLASRFPRPFYEDGDTSSTDPYDVGNLEVEDTDPKSLSFIEYTQDKIYKELTPGGKKELEHSVSLTRSNAVDKNVINFPKTVARWFKRRQLSWWAPPAGRK